MISKEKKRTSTTIWSYCTSKKLALLLIILLAILSTIGMIIPQETFNAEAYGQWAKVNTSLSTFVENFQLHKLFKSYIFLITTVIFTFNLVCCTIEQIIRALKIRKFDNLNIINASPNEAVIKSNNKSAISNNEIIKILRKHKYTVLEQQPYLFGSKGRFGVWGATIFHIGLIVIILGGLISNYFSMSGYFRVSEGEVFQENHDAYNPLSIEEAPLFNEESGHIGYQFKLEKQDRFYVGKRVEYSQSHVTAGEKDKDLNLKGTLVSGQPFHFKGRTFYYKDSGYSPELIFRRQGQDILRTYHSLDTKEIGNTYHFNFTGDFNIFQNEGYIIKLYYFPDLIEKDGNKYDYDSMEIKNPAVYLEVSKDGKEIFNGLVKKDQWVKFDDFEFSLGDTLFWIGVDVVYDPGVNILFAGFIISLIGVIILYGLVPKKIMIEVKEQNGKNICIIRGLSRKYHLFFKEEFNLLVKEIERNLGRVEIGDN